MSRYLFLALLLACTPACAVSIWNSTPVDPVLGTYRIPVDVSSSGGPSHITPLTLQDYIESSEYFSPRAIQVVGVDETAAGSFAAYNACADVSHATNVGCEGIQIVTDAAAGWMQVVAIPSDDYPDVSVAVTPAGVGSLSAAVADGTSTGGNNRGENAVDWQTVRSDQLMVASGAYSTISGGEDNTATGQHATVSGGASGYASGTYSVVSGGTGNISTGPRSVVSGGTSNTASAESSVVGGGSSNVASGVLSVVSGGESNTASGDGSWVPGGNGGSTRGVQQSFAYAGPFGQAYGALLGVSATDDTPVTMTTSPGNSGAAYNLVFPTGWAGACSGAFVAVATSGSAGFNCSGVVKNVAGTTSLVTGACSAIGTPDSALSTASMSMQADDTDNTVELVFTGVSGTAINVSGELKCSTGFAP